MKVDDDSEVAKIAGNKFFASGDYISALTAYTESIVLNRTNPILYSNRAATFLKLESWNNAVKDCETAITLIEQEKISKSALLVKLLWRKSIGLRNIEQFQNALGTINKALLLDPSNEKLISEKELILSELPQSNEKDTVLEKEASVGSFVSIQIHDVQDIPRGFFSGGTSGTGDANVEPFSIQTENPTIPSVVIEEPLIAPVQSSKTPEFTFDEIQFPAEPSIQFLLSLTENQPKNNVQYYEYLLHIQSKYFEKLFSVSGVEPEFLNLYLSACIYALETGKLIHQSNIIATIVAFTVCPRFSLSSMFADSKLLNRLRDLFKEKLCRSLDDIWK